MVRLEDLEYMDLNSKFTGAEINTVFPGIPRLLLMNYVFIFIMLIQDSLLFSPPTKSIKSFLKPIAKLIRLSKDAN